MQKISNINENSKNNDIDYYKRQIKILEDKLKRQKPAERPFEYQNKQPTSRVSY
jgi:hypothetical protein